MEEMQALIGNCKYVTSLNAAKQFVYRYALSRILYCGHSIQCSHLVLIFCLHFKHTSQNRASRVFGSIWAVGLVVQLTSAAVADVAGSHAATTVARQTTLRFRHFDDVVTDSGLQSVEPPSAQPFHNSDSRTTPRTTALR